MLNEKKTNSLSIKDSEELLRKDAATSTGSTSLSTTKLDDGETSTNSTYEYFLWFFAYTQMFAWRLFKDFLSSIIGRLIAKPIVPNHIANLISVQKRLRVERESHSVSYTRFTLLKSKCIAPTVNKSKSSSKQPNSLIPEKTSPAIYQIALQQ